MIEYEKLHEIVKTKMSPKRFKHSEGVVKRAIEYATIYHLDINTTKLVAIAHDIAKELPLSEEQALITKYNLKFDNIEKSNHSLVHAKLGAAICFHEYGFTKEMSDAILYHTTGKENMTTLEKVIYLADATEENRPFPITEFVAMTKENIDKAMLAVTKWSLEYLLQSNKLIHPASINCYNYYYFKIYPSK